MHGRAQVVFLRRYLGNRRRDRRGGDGPLSFRAARSAPRSPGSPGRSENAALQRLARACRRAQEQHDRSRCLSGQRTSCARRPHCAPASAWASSCRPMTQKLGEFDRLLGDLEAKRQREAGSLREQIDQFLGRADKLENATVNLTTQTSTLVTALRNPASRGKWGEMQLRNVVEKAGMLAYCDFSEQQTVALEEARVRPDMTVNLPDERCVFVDAKAPLDAMQAALEAADEATRREAGQAARPRAARPRRRARAAGLPNRKRLGRLRRDVRAGRSLPRLGVQRRSRADRVCVRQGRAR